MKDQLDIVREAVDKARDGNRNETGFCRLKMQKRRSSPGAGNIMNGDHTVPLTI